MYASLNSCTSSLTSTPEFFHLRLLFAYRLYRYVPLTHHNCWVLTPKLNPSALSATVSRLVSSFMVGKHLLRTQACSLPCLTWAPWYRVLFSMIIYAARQDRIGPPSALLSQSWQPVPCTEHPAYMTVSFLCSVHYDITKSACTIIASVLVTIITGDLRVYCFNSSQTYAWVWDCSDHWSTAF